jgi:hypothetical protein
VDALVLSVFQFEVAFQCKTILTAATRLDGALAKSDTDEIWTQLQIILLASANLSKMFWGSGGKRRALRKDLRDSVQIDDKSPLRDTNLRNDFEHFDERLEDWYSSSTHKNFVGRNIGPPGSFNVPTDPKRRFQHFDPSSGLVSFWGHSVPIRDLIAEANRIFPLAQSEFAKVTGP